MSLEKKGWEMSKTKHFIYMDTYLLNSYISQFNDGLTTNTHTEITDETASTKAENNADPTSEVNMKFSLPGILGVGVARKDELFSSSTSLTDTQIGKELIDKIVHDNAFNQFIKYLNANKLLKQDDYSLGDYVSISGFYEFWDLNYLEMIFNENMINFITDFGVDGFKQLFNQNKGKMPNKADITNYKKQQNEQYENINRIIKICKDIMPFNQFMMINNCFVPLNESFLRESINSIRFKYSGKITLIGKYTSDYKGVAEVNGGSSFSQIFNSLDVAVNTFLKGSLNIPDFAKVINPIALYFE